MNISILYHKYVPIKESKREPAKFMAGRQREQKRGSAQCEVSGGDRGSPGNKVPQVCLPGIVGLWSHLGRGAHRSRWKVSKMEVS